MRRLLLLVALALAVVPASGARSPRLPALPSHWPRTLELGLSDTPEGGAAALRRSAPFGFRYQYLAGGVNTGRNWTTWNPDGTFASRYVNDSWAHGAIPVLTYYMLLQSKPRGDDERATDLAHLRDPALMSAYWEQVRLLFHRVRGTKPVVVHVEPDLWGYLEKGARKDDAATTPGAIGFARSWVQLRNELAPNVLLAYHMSGWGTNHDVVYEDPPNEKVVRYATHSAAFYRSLRTRFDVAFAEYSDRDAAYYAKVKGNRRAWFKAADFHRHLLYAKTFVRHARVRLVFWQIPLGNTRMRAMDNTWGHFQDNRVQWLLESRAHLRAYVRAGVIAFLFGGGMVGTTCACDAVHDGVTNPPPVDGNTRVSLSADDDGGLFRDRARAYYRRGTIALPR
jgi:hypothetical protein